MIAFAGNLSILGRFQKDGKRAWCLVCQETVAMCTCVRCPYVANVECNIPFLLLQRLIDAISCNGGLLIISSSNKHGLRCTAADCR